MTHCGRHRDERVALYRWRNDCPDAQRSSDEAAIAALLAPRSIGQGTGIRFRWSREGMAIGPRDVRSGLKLLNYGVNGAAYRTRTCDPIITNDVLYQLS